MRLSLWHYLLPVAGVAVLLSASVPADEWKGNVNFMLGPRTADDDLAPADEPISFGAAVSFGKVDWPLMIALDVVVSRDEGSDSYSYPGYYYYYDLDVDVEVTTRELAVGVRKFWGENVHPFIGGGIELFQTDYQVDASLFGLPSITIFDDDDTDLAFWANAGIYWDLGDRFNLGAHVRYSDADATISSTAPGIDLDLDLSGFHYGVLAGWRW